MKRKMDAVVARAPPKLIGAYEKHQEIGRGTYGTVYAGVRSSSADSNGTEAPAERVAIKKVLGRVDAGRREAAFLERCRDARHIVQILDTVERNDKLYLILEYMESDLEAIIKAKDEVPLLSVSHVKTYLHMLLTGVQELHARGILHRDLKPNNLLLSRTQHTAKITDFGMATMIDPPSNADGDSSSAASKKRSIQVVTRAYRAPELFFGEDEYGVEVDVWSIGCIFAELLLREPFFDGASDIDQLSLIFKALGSPGENGWEKASELPFFLRFKDTNSLPVKDQFPKELSSAGVDLLSQLLQLDPKKRISVDDALKHEFFSEEPLPADPTELEIPEDQQRKLPSSTAVAVSRRETVNGAAAAGVVVLASENENAFVIKGRRLV
ncbi:Cmgc/cdk protein kinase [Globisporangium polare]